jgi:uncharacterized protein (DUF1697 family)
VTNTYIVLLRGINVGGHRKLPMVELRDALSNVGFQDVKTYIQSGNVIFKSDKAPEHVEKQIKQEIKKQFGYDVPCLVRTISYWKTALANNPFQDKDPKKVSFTFLSEEPNDPTETFSSANDHYITKGKTIYLFCPNGFKNSKLLGNFFEKKFNLQATNRNWNTVKKLLELI